MRARLAEPAFSASVFLVTLVLTVPLLHLLSVHLGVPLNYSGDALAGSTHVKALVDHGWYDYVPELGAPEGRHGNDFVLPDNLQVATLALMGQVHGNWVHVLNAYYLLTYPLAAVAGAWFFRVLGLNRLVAGTMALLYAFAPYHFYRDEGHLFLSAYWCVPLAAVLVWRALRGEPLWSRRPWAALLLVVVGCTSGYYALFGVFLLGIAGLVALLQTRAWRRFVGVVAAQALLLVTIVANTLPNALYERAHGTNLTALVRSPKLTENSSFKLTSLLLPSPHHRIGALAAFRQRYDSTFPLPSEEPTLGLVAAVGLVLLLAVVLVGLTRRGEVSERWADQRRLATLALAAFLLGTVGGLSTLFALFVTDNVRGWNRISVFLALWCLGSIGLLLQQVARRALSAGLCAVLLVVGLLDQSPAADPAGRAKVLQAWGSDSRFVAALEHSLPAGAMVLDLPYLGYPESSRAGNVKDSEQFRLSLHSTTLRWSYGGFRGRPDADWQATYRSDPVGRQVALAAVAGFDGAVVDRNGWKDHGVAVEAELTDLLKVTPVVSDDGLFSFFDTRPYRASVADRPGLSDVADHVLHHPVAYPSAFSTAHPRIAFDNPRDSAVTVEATVRLVAPDQPSAVRLTWPDGTTETVSGASSAVVATRTLTLEPGRTWMDVAVPGDATTPKGTAASEVRLRFVAVLLPDPVVDAFVP